MISDPSCHPIWITANDSNGDGTIPRTATARSGSGATLESDIAGDRRRLLLDDDDTYMCSEMAIGSSNALVREVRGRTFARTQNQEGNRLDQKHLLHTVRSKHPKRARSEYFGFQESRTTVI